MLLPWIICGAALVVIALFGGLLLYRFPEETKTVCRTRHSIFCGLLLVLLPVFAYFFNSLLGGLFVLEGWLQLGLLTLVSLMAGTMVITTFWVTNLNAAARFEIGYVEPLEKSVDPTSEQTGHTSSTGWGFGRWSLFFLLGLTIPVSTMCFTYLDARQLSVPSAIAAIQRLFPGLLAGCLLGIVVLLILAILQRWLLDPGVTSKGLLPFEDFAKRHLHQFDDLDVAGWIADWLPKPFPGYLRETSKGFQWRPGHAQLALVVFFLLGFYASWFVVTVIRNPSPETMRIVPPLAYGISILVIATAVLTAASFFLDRYGWSSMITVGLFYILLHLGLGTDHYFDPWPSVAAERKVETPKPVPLRNVFRSGAWRFPQAGPDRKRTLVVVNASGGGIQAAAWTTKVLTGLERKFAGFGESVGLLSAVSGGSVGVMYYAAHRTERANNGDFGDVMTAEIATRINQLSRASSLEATAWGMSFPDLTRTLLPPIVPRDVDRGWALEQAWKHRIAEGKEPRSRDVRLLDWAEPMLTGKMPVVIFNATRVETGQRLAISPILYDDSRPYDDPVPLDEPIDFLANYRDANPFVTTAARLSATFSYVSPICRAVENPRIAAPTNDPHRYAYHVADGGYADNEGLVTSLKWVGKVIQERRDAGDELPFDRVLMIRIVPFPKHDFPREDQDAKASAGNRALPANSGVWQSLIGPLATLNSVRTASQAERGDLETALAVEVARFETLIGNQNADVRNLAETARPILDKGLELGSSLAERLSTELAAASDPLPRYRNLGKEIVEYARRAPIDDTERSRLALLGETLKRYQPVRFHTVTFQCDPPDKNYTPPLSWKLTPSQQRQIDEAWDAIWAVPEKSASDPSAGELPDHIKPGDLSRFF